jgi:uncharacterized protein YjdB
VSGSGVIDVVSNYLNSFTIEGPSEPMRVGETALLGARATGFCISIIYILLPGAVAWTSSDPSVATVSSTGVVTARAPGTVTITGTLRPDNVPDSLELTVTP